MSRTVRVLLDDKEVSEAFIRYACMIKGIDRDRVLRGESIMVVRALATGENEISQMRVELEVET